MKRIKITFLTLLAFCATAMNAALPQTGDTGYLYNPATGKFLSHGVTSVSNSGAKVDNYGHLFRGSTLNGYVSCTPEDLQTLRDLGVGGEIDLRWKADYDKDLGCGMSAFGFTQGEDYYFAAANDYTAANLNESATQQSLKTSFQDRIDVILALSGMTLRDKFENYFINKLGVPTDDIAYFRSVMVDEEGETTWIQSVENGRVGADVWCTIDGVRLGRQPVCKGLYIKNGLKFVKK